MKIFRLSSHHFPISGNPRITFLKERFWMNFKCYPWWKNSHVILWMKFKLFHLLLVLLLCCRHISRKINRKTFKCGTGSSSQSSKSWKFRLFQLLFCCFLNFNFPLCKHTKAENTAKKRGESSANTENGEWKAWKDVFMHFPPHSHSLPLLLLLSDLRSLHRSLVDSERQ